MTMAEAVKRFLLDWDPTVFDDNGSGVIRCFPLSSGRYVYLYVPFRMKKGMRLGKPILVSIDPERISDVRFSTDDEFHECMRSTAQDEGTLE